MLLVASVAALTAGSAGASTLYSNGTGNGTFNISYNYSQGWELANSFTTAGGSTANGLTWQGWDTIGTSPGGTISWEITSGNPLSGGAFTVLGSGTASVTATLGGATTGELGFDYYNESISFSGVALTGGNYWIMLSNGDDGTGFGGFWDVSNGASDAWQANPGLSQPGVDINGEFGPGSNSESFSILGTTGVPEPAVWALMLTGIAGIDTLLRSRRRTVAA